MNEIKKGSIVKYIGDNENDRGHYRVTARFACSVNLGSIFGDKIYLKRIPIADVVEDHDAWYEDWTKSEAYMSM